MCRPLRIENVRGASIDLTLGEFFWRCDADPHGVFNPYDEDEIRRYFAGPFQAKPYESVYRKLITERIDVRLAWPPPRGDSEMMGRRSYNMPSPFNGIPDDWPVIVLRPGERILAHTHEFAGIYSPGTSQIHARSSSGRIGIKVCDDAGLGDPSYVNRWTLEMRNDNREAIILPVGERVAQINFHQTGPTRAHYGAEEELYETKYQSGIDLDRIVERWRPEDMLPRNYMDRRVAPAPTDSDSYAEQIRSVAALLGAMEADETKPEVAPPEVVE